MNPGNLTIYRGCTPLELPPLHDCVEPDALNKLFQHQGGSGTTETVLSFKMKNWNVFIRDDGCIRVCDGTRPTDPTPVFTSPTV
jgi:hypothetical protein